MSEVERLIDSRPVKFASRPAKCCACDAISASSLAAKRACQESAFQGSQSAALALNLNFKDRRALISCRCLAYWVYWVGFGC